MRTHGSLTKWNDDRGFGFILPSQGTEEIFVHVSAFPRKGLRPHIGELIAFDIETAADGRKRAIRVSRPGSERRPAERRPGLRRTTPRQGHRSYSALVAMALLGVIVAIGYLRWHAVPTSADMRSEPVEAAAIAPAPAFTCDGRTMCSQMHSCAEATYFLKHCPRTQMDGDGDGVPCEQQWCNGSGDSLFRGR